MLPGKEKSRSLSPKEDARISYCSTVPDKQWNLEQVSCRNTLNLLNSPTPKRLQKIGNGTIECCIQKHILKCKYPTRTDHSQCLLKHLPFIREIHFMKHKMADSCIKGCIEIGQSSFPVSIPRKLSKKDLTDVGL